MALTLASGCGGGASTSCEGDHCDEGGAQDVVLLDHGADWEALRQLYYYTSEGARLVPYDWFLHLERAGSTELFRDAANMHRLGFSVDPVLPADDSAAALNPDRLPIGFARDPRPGQYDTEWVGLTCAACHSSQFTYRGRTFRVDGAGGFPDLKTMEAELLAAIDDTLADTDKQARFAAAILGAGADQDRAKLIADVTDYASVFRARLARNESRMKDGSILAYGFGRIDAFAQITNDLLCAALPIPENCRAPVAPTRIPRLWGTGDLEWARSADACLARL
jgi:hypothetical protein